MSDADSTLQALGGFKILRKLGAGGMATVYKAHDGSLNRVVAIKVIHDYLARQPEFVARFHREARAAARLSHPNIVQIYAIGDEQGVPFFSMEHVDGKSLQAIVDTEGFLTPKRAVRILEQVAQALAAAHEAGIVHRDIKPSNIMVDLMGRVKVTDFGIAQVASENRLTQTGMMLGTPGYTSPEQCLGEALDDRSDIYSLGVTAYEILTGRTAFDADTPAALVLKIVDYDPPPLETVNPTVPPALARIVEKMMHKRAAERFQSAEELIESLRAVDLDTVAATAPHDNRTRLADTRPAHGEPTRLDRRAAATTATSPQAHRVEGRTTRLAMLRSRLTVPISTALAGGAAAGVIVALRMLGVLGTEPVTTTSAGTLVGAPPSQSASTDAAEATPAAVPFETDPPSPIDDPAAVSTAAAQASDAEGNATLPEPRSPDPAVDPAQPPPETRSADAESRDIEPAGGAGGETRRTMTVAAPAPNTVVTAVAGEYEHLDLVRAWLETALVSGDFELIDVLPANRSVEQAARFEVSATVRVVASRQLVYFGRAQMAYTAAMTVQATDLSTGTRAAGPFSTTVEYTSTNFEETLKEGTDEVAQSLVAALGDRLGR